MAGPVLAAVAVLSAPATAAAAAAVPHMAHYAMRLLSARSGSGVEGVTGDMAVRWEADCSGWTMTHKSVFRASYSGGQNVTLTAESTTWEARDGARYNFHTRTLLNGQETERLEGHATLGARNEAVFAAPEPRVIPLPPEAIFPMRHTQAVLDAAERGTPILAARLFDGFSFEGAVLVNAVLGPKQPGAQRPDAAFPALARLPSWKVQLAFFEATQASEPKSEIGMRIYGNGVADGLVLDFGDFRVQADLKNLKVEPVPSCD